MDHAEALEQLELAAVEPDGFDRLMAGDTPAAAAVAAHLAGCPSCSGELERLRRAAPLLRDVVRTTPPEDLRDRTLAYVREHGVARGAAGVAAAPAPTAVGAAPAPTPVGAAPAPASTSPVSTSVALPARSGPSRRVLAGSLAAMAATVVISVVATTAWIARDGGEYDTQQAAIAGLENVTVATLTISADPDSQRVALSAADGSAARGSLLFSPSTTELVVVADGLERPPAGQEYRCWLLVDGQREVVGRMDFAEDLAYWVGWTPSVGTAPAGTTFGVSLTGSGGSDAAADPILLGTL